MRKIGFDFQLEMELATLPAGRGPRLRGGGVGRLGYCRLECTPARQTASAHHPLRYAGFKRRGMRAFSLLKSAG